MWVVKLGGSLALSGQLRSWIEALTGQGGGLGRRARPALAPDMIIVPGGGPFANRVREMQASLGFNDSTAHTMAVLAMEQYGLMLAEFCPALVPVSSAVALMRTIRHKGIPLWMPSRMISRRSDIPGLWEVTSDSLAAWLAAYLKATCLILVKSVDPVQGNSQPNEQPAVSLSELQERGVIDCAFGTFAKGTGVDVHCVGPADLAGFVDALKGGVAPGIKIDLTR